MPPSWWWMRRIADAVGAVLPAWVVARAVVAVSLIVAHAIVTRVRPGNPAAVFRVDQGLLGWDAGWYQSIAAHGYAAAGRQSLRFFPAFPLAGHLVGSLPGVGPGLALVILSNLFTLAGMAVLWLLIEHDFGDRDLARRSVWLLALAPPAFTLVMGYAEGALLLCTTVTLLAIRTGRWWWAAAAGVAAGAVRPLGLLLMVPVAVEAYRDGAFRIGGSKRSFSVVARLAAVLAPLVGVGAYLGWVGVAFGDPLLPFQLQDQPGHRGPITEPFAAMWHNLVAASHGHHLGSALHVPWVLLCFVLLVVAFRRLPFAYGAFAASVVAVSVATANLDSFERYALSAFPLVIAASTLSSRRWVERSILAMAVIGMLAYSLLAFLNIYVP
ncbi:MAG: hypothetical protein ACYCV7_11520 [Acidimicrobiales bacterium]